MQIGTEQRFRCGPDVTPVIPRWLEHRIPPPVIDLSCAGLMWWLSALVPAAQLWPRGGAWWVWVLAAGLALAGGAVSLSGLREFARARTTFNPLTPDRASALVTTGIYRFTRNPMYLGMLLVLIGWGLWLGNAAALVIGPLLAVLSLNALQIRPEERVMQARFGEVYTRYRARVRRWL